MLNILAHSSPIFLRSRSSLNLQTCKRSDALLPAYHGPLTCPGLVSSLPTIALSPLAATLMDIPASVANKRLTARLNPLDATLTKIRGGESPRPYIFNPLLCEPPARGVYPDLSGRHSVIFFHPLPYPPIFPETFSPALSYLS